MKWAQLSHFAEFNGMQLELVKITRVNDLKILEQMRSHAFLPIIIQRNYYVPLSRLTSEIKRQWFW